MESYDVVIIGGGAAGMAAGHAAARGGAAALILEKGVPRDDRPDRWRSLTEWGVAVEAPETTAPLLSKLALQLIAYEIAAAAGRDIDQPRNLAKSVTVE